MGCLTGLLGEEGDVPPGEGGGDCSPVAWSSMKQPRLPCVLLLTVSAAAAARALSAVWWGVGSVLLGPAVVPVAKRSN